MIWRLLPYMIGNPAWNMAVDEAILQCYVKDLNLATLRFYGWNPPTVSVGYFQDIGSEINLVGLSKRGFGLVRRNTGGRAVLHHEELTYSIIAGTRDGLPDGLIDSYLYISSVLVDAFEKLGVYAQLHEGMAGKNKGSGACFESPSWYELTVDGRKLVGSAQFRQKGSLLQHGSILFGFSAVDLGSVLLLGEDSLEDWTRRMNQKVTSFKDQGVEVQPEELVQAIQDSFTKLHSISFFEGCLTEKENQLANELMEKKYANPNWNLQRGDSKNKLRSFA